MQELHTKKHIEIAQFSKTAAKLLTLTFLQRLYMQASGEFLAQNCWALTNLEMTSCIFFKYFIQ